MISLIYCNVFFLSAAVIYSILIIYIYYGWKKTKELNISDEIIRHVSIIIAARNEAENIDNCIQSILENQYPTSSFEIIVVDDHSSDETADIIKKYGPQNVRHISQHENVFGKKAAISLGVSFAKFDIILCTDADCVVGKYWIKSHVENLNTSKAMLSTGLVLPQNGQSLSGRFQWMDFAATMAITANGFFRNSYYLANGANLCYLKESFNKVKGYEDNQNIASGDDVFLVNKIAKMSASSVSFLKSRDSLVYTKPEPDWFSFIKQRKRWATKSLHQDLKAVAFIQAFVFIFSLMLIIGLVLSITFLHHLWPAFLLALMIKMLIDYLFLNQLAQYFDNKEVMKSFLPCFFIYFGHIIVSGYFALFPSDFSWKDRKTK